MTGRDWLEKANREKFALGAFNVGNIETFKAVVMAAASKMSPIIIETSPGETDWLGADNIVDLAKNYSQDLGIPILINLDHALSLGECQKGIEAGFDLIHFDGSKLTLEENIATTKQVVKLTHSKGLTAEGELDHIGGSSEIHPGAASLEVSKVAMTDPEEAARFVKETGVDIFASFVGNVHGLYAGESKNLDIERLRQIKNRCPGVFLSLHGSSGIPETQIKEAIEKEGIIKVNLNTEVRRIFKDSLAMMLKQYPEEYAMYKSEGPVVAAVQKLVEHKIDLFGSTNKA